MAIGGIIAGATAGATAAIYAVASGIGTHIVKSNTRDAQSNLQNALKGTSQNFDQYMNDSLKLGFIDRTTQRQAISAYHNATTNGIKSLNKKDAKALTKVYNDLYKNDETFRANWDNKYANLSNEEKLKWLDGAMSDGGGVSIPSPAYMDTSFETYQKEVEPVKLYTNKELAKLYDLDFNYENILRDYKAGGKAKVAYGKYVSDVAKNMEDRNSTENATSYLDSIRKAKSEAIDAGMTTGARAAQEVLETKKAMQAKAESNSQTAAARTEAIAKPLLENARAEINAAGVYNRLAQSLGNTSNVLYANDTARYGSDMNANANFFAADENLKAERAAANALMGSIRNNVASQARASYGGLNDVDWIFKNIMLPANNGNVDKAVSELLNTTYTQNTGYNTAMEKWAGVDR